jgi:hypothetical protein
LKEISRIKNEKADDAELRTVRKLKKELVEAKKEAKKIKIEKEKEKLSLSVPEVSTEEYWESLGDLSNKPTRKKNTRIDA